MFCDGSVDSMEFPKKIQFFRHVHTSARKLAGPVSNNVANLSFQSSKNDLREVLTIEYLKESVEKCMSCLKIPVGKFSFDDNWNANFHSLLNKCHLTEEFPPWVLPTSYGVNQTCVHVLQVDLSYVALNTLHLTVLEEICNDESETSQINDAALFIQSTIFGNPI